MNEWLIEFKELREIKKNKFYKVLGPFLIGIELIKLPRINSYRPYFNISPLYKDNIEECLNKSLFMVDFKNKKGNQLEIDYEDKFNKLQEVMGIIKDTLTFNLNDKSISYKSLIDFIDHYLYSYNHVMYNTHAGSRAGMFEIKFYATLYCNYDCQTVLEEISLDKMKWDMNIFTNWHGDYNVWLNNLNNDIIDTKSFYQKVQTNKLTNKVKKLLYSELD